MVDGQQVADTLQCVHCGMHWDRKPGSGTVRGWCWNCNGVLCGKEKCVTECKPLEKWLEEVESEERKNAWRREMMEEQQRAGGVLI